MTDSLDEGMVAPPDAGKWQGGKAGDVIKGTYLGSKPFQGDYEPTFIHQFKVIAGSYHAVSGGKKRIVADSVTELVPDQIVGVFEHFTFADKIKGAKVGQKVLLRFLGMKPTKDGSSEYCSYEIKLEENFDPTSVV